VTRWASVALALLTLLGCARSETARPIQHDQAKDSVPLPATPDRLPPGRLLEGERQVFGLRIPRDMSVVSETRQTAEVVGPVRADDLSDYVRARVLVNHVEMGEGRIIFPQVKLRGDTSPRALRVEVVDGGFQTRLLLQNLVSRAPVEGLSEDERWRRAGMTPKGQLIDPNSLE